jgi:hypothetical protein
MVKSMTWVFSWPICNIWQRSEIQLTSFLDSNKDYKLLICTSIMILNESGFICLILIQKLNSLATQYHAMTLWKDTDSTDPLLHPIGGGAGCSLISGGVVDDKDTCRDQVGARPPRKDRVVIISSSVWVCFQTEFNSSRCHSWLRGLNHSQHKTNDGFLKPWFRN